MSKNRGEVIERKEEREERVRDCRDMISLFKERSRNVREFYFLTFGHLNIRGKKFSLLLLYLYQTETKINKFLLATRRKK